MVQFLEQRALRGARCRKWAKGEGAGGGGGEEAEAENKRTTPQPIGGRGLLTQNPSAPLQLLSPAVGTKHCQSGTGFQGGQHCFIGYLGCAHTINGLFISPFSCQYRTSQSDSVIIIKKAFFFFLFPHTLFNPNNIWELQPLSCKRETDLDEKGGKVQSRPYITTTKFQPANLS